MTQISKLNIDIKSLQNDLNNIDTRISARQEKTNESLTKKQEKIAKLTTELKQELDNISEENKSELTNIDKSITLIEEKISAKEKQVKLTSVVDLK